MRTALQNEQDEREFAFELKHALLEAIPDAVVVADSNGIIYLVNMQTELLFGYPRNELMGKPVEVLIPDRLHSAHVEHRHDYLDNPHTRPMGAQLNLVGRRKDGKEIPLEINLSPTMTPRGMYIITVIRRLRAK